MDVMTTADYKNVPSGSCIHEVRLAYKDKYYSGVWSSMWGSYRVRVPVAICKERKDPFEELFEYLEQNPPESAEDPEVKFDKCDYLFTEMAKALAAHGITYHMLDVTEMPDDELCYEFAITVIRWGSHVQDKKRLKIMKQQLVERRYDILKRMAQMAVIDMFPKMPQKESTLDKYFEEREKKERREKWINQQI